MHRLAGRRSTAAVDMFARGTAVVLILFSLCDEAQSMLRTQCGVRDCVCVDHRRRKWETSSDNLCILLLADARMGRSSFKQLVLIMTVYVSIALFFYEPNSFTAGVSKSITFIEFTIFVIIFRIYFRFLKDNAEVLEELASKISLEYKTKNDGCGPEMQNRAAGSEETPHLFNKHAV